MSIIAYLIIFFGMVNLCRISLLLIGSDIYSLKQSLRYRTSKKRSYPKLSVIIPAHNEEKSIIHSILSVLESNYPMEKLEVVVVDDGSTDDTLTIIKDFKKEHKLKNLTVASQKNSGKAKALNNGMKNYAKGEFVICLDSDSYLEKNALTNAIKYFDDKRVMALSANVKIAPGKGLLNRIQRFEYLVCYQMKRAQTAFNIEYIIGGIGSMFRVSELKKIDFYDSNTVTEDIDITFKILRSGNKDHRVVYGSDVIAFTQSVLSISDLIKQRYRWKWGRSQTFLKNIDIFFTRKKTFTKGLTWFYLPFAIFGDLAFLFEPVFLLYILTTSIIYKDLVTPISACVVFTFYLFMNILAENTLSYRQKITYIFFAPSMYFLFYVLSFVEYIALLKSILKIRNLKKSLSPTEYNWEPVKRHGLGKNKATFQIRYFSLGDKSRNDASQYFYY